MSVGIKSMDDDHKKIIGLINKLFRSITQKDTHDVGNKIFLDLINCVLLHIKNEEELLQRTRYPSIEVHKKALDDFSEEFSSLLAAHINDRRSVEAIDVLTLTLKWWGKHKQMVDEKYKEHFAANEVA